MAILKFLNEEKENPYLVSELFIKDVVESLHLDESKSIEAASLYKSNVSKILESFSINESILVNGEVQSGKTNNLIVAASSLNETDNYQMIIYLTGRLNDINDQNHERFFDIFDKHRENYLVTKLVSHKDIKEDTVEEMRKGKTLVVNMLKESWRMKELISFVKKYNTSFLLINDEGDDASLTKTNIELFKEIRNLNVNKKLLTITATPYNNLIHKYLYEDYVVLESSPYYTGVEKFEYEEVSSDDYVDSINEIIDGWFLTSISKENSQLLVNVATQKDSHDEIYKVIESYVDQVIDINLSNLPFEAVDIADDVMHKGNIKILNGNNENISQGDRQIIIGGHKLSRGVTFKYLTQQLILSKQSEFNSSTLLQKARWCGYRNVDETKIFMNKELIEAFKEIKDLNKWVKDFNFHKDDFKKVFDNKKYKRIKVGK